MTVQLLALDAIPVEHKRIEVEGARNRCHDVARYGITKALDQHVV